MNDHVGQALMRVVSWLKIAMIVSVYFSLSVIIILVILGNGP